MAKKKKVIKEEPKPEPVVLVDEVRVEPKAPEVNRSVSVKVLNHGNPFVYDLSPWGYGQRWPTGAVYTIPMSAYLDCLEKGMNGTVV
jgi:hypothetical protein